MRPCATRAAASPPRACCARRPYARRHRPRPRRGRGQRVTQHEGDLVMMTINQQKLEELHGRLFAEISAGYGGVMVALGDKLGLYRAMAGAGPLSSHEVAKRSGCAERYVREWLNSQVAGGYVDYHPSSTSYELTPEQAAVLADGTSPFFLPFAWQIVASMWADEAKSAAAFKTGNGV